MSSNITRVVLEPVQITVSKLGKENYLEAESQSIPLIVNEAEPESIGNSNGGIPGFPYLSTMLDIIVITDFIKTTIQQYAGIG